MAAGFQAKDLLSVVSLFAKVVQSNEGPYLSSSQIWRPLGDGQRTEVVSDDSLTVMFKDPREYVKKYEGMLSLFRALTASLEYETTSLKGQLDSAVRYCGISKLPDELLLAIMDNVVSEYHDTFTLAHVCSRFRSLIISSPKLWTNCWILMPVRAAGLDSIVNMSRGLPLKASLTSSFTHESDILDAERILKYQSLLGTLEVTVVDADLQHPLFKEVKLQVLHTLKLGYLKLHQGIPASHFYETWEMPGLRYLETNFIPLRALGKTIVSFTLDISDLSCDLFFGLDRSLEFLSSCPLLESLDLRFDYISTYITPETGAAVIMHNLRTLALQASSAKYFSWLARFLERLVIDNVTDLSLRLNKLRRSCFNVEVMAKRMTQYQETEMWGPVIVSRLAKIPRLREMKLYIEEERIGREELESKGPSKDEYIWAFISVVRELSPTVERFVSISPLHHIHMYRKHTHINGGWTELDIDHGKTLTLEQLLFFMDWAKIKSGTIILRDSPLIPGDELRSAIPDCIKVG